MVQFEKYVAKYVQNNDDDEKYNDDRNKNQIQNNNDHVQDEKHNKTTNGWHCDVEFYSSMIKSGIVYLNSKNDNIDAISSLKYKARLLYLKYIEYGSNYEIDLDFNVRQCIINIMEISDEWDEYEI